MGAPGSDLLENSVKFQEIGFPGNFRKFFQNISVFSVEASSIFSGNILDFSWTFPEAIPDISWTFPGHFVELAGIFSEIYQKLVGSFPNVSWTFPGK